LRAKFQGYKKASNFSTIKRCYLTSCHGLPHLSWSFLANEFTRYDSIFGRLVRRSLALIFTSAYVDRMPDSLLISAGLYRCIFMGLSITSIRVRLYAGWPSALRSWTSDSGCQPVSALRKKPALENVSLDIYTIKNVSPRWPGLQVAVKPVSCQGQ